MPTNIRIAISVLHYQLTQLYKLCKSSLEILTHLHSTFDPTVARLMYLLTTVVYVNYELHNYTFILLLSLLIR